MKYGVSQSRTSSYCLFINLGHMLRDFLAIHSQPQRKGTHFYSHFLEDCVIRTSQIYELAILLPQNWFTLLPDNNVHMVSLIQYVRLWLNPKVNEPSFWCYFGQGFVLHLHAAEKTFASAFMQGRASAKFLSSNIASSLDNLETSSLPLLPLNYYSLNLIISYTWGIPTYCQRKLKLFYIFKREKMKQFSTGCKNIPDKECISPASSLLMEIFIPLLIIFSWGCLQKFLSVPVKM